MQTLAPLAAAALSPLTRQRIRGLFAEDAVAEAELRLASVPWSPEPSAANTPAGLERLHLAVVRLSGGDLALLGETIELARIDWRDVLVGAGFGNDVAAHASWTPRRLDDATLRGWKSGDKPADVAFGLNDVIDARFGKEKGRRGSVQSLVGLEPEPRYLVALESGGHVVLYQTSMRLASPRARGNAP